MNTLGALISKFFFFFEKLLFLQNAWLLLLLLGRKNEARSATLKKRRNWLVVCARLHKICSQMVQKATGDFFCHYPTYKRSQLSKALSQMCNIRGMGDKSRE